MTDGSTATHRILIVDDEETTRDLLKIIFEEDPYQITTADGVQAAIALLEEQPFDLLMTDKNMPDGTGLDVAQRVRDLGLDTEIIMISAYASVESAVKAMHLAVADYVEKPFRDTEVIRRSVAGALAVLTLKRANRELVAELQTKNAELEALATRDPLTKLFNHAFFQQALDGEVVRSSRHHQEFGLLFIDLDDFKSVNDTHGHLVGDKLLSGFASLLQGEVRRSDMSFRLRTQDIAARYGGDEFAIILPETPKHGAATKAERLRSLMSEHGSELMDLPLHQTVSIGVAAYPQDAKERTQLIEIADRCLYAAKQAGRNRIVACSEAVLERNDTPGSAAVVSAEILESLKRTLEEERFDFVYQPVVEADTRRTVAYEALCRPRDPAFPDPATLLRAAENSGRVGYLGRALRRSAVEILDALPDDCLLFVNLHPQELNDPEVTTVYPALQPHARRVVFELTDTAGIKSFKHVARSLERLREAGFRFALDHLGADYSGLNSLAILEPDFAKLDRQIVRAAFRDKRVERLVKHIVEFTLGEGMKVIASGIETDEELALLTGFGVTLVQGFLVGKPIPFAELAGS